LAYRRSAQADADYFAIYRYGVERYGVTQAEAYADRLDRAFEMLAVFPRAGRVRTEVDATIRTHPVGVHIVLYELDEDDDVIILRIPHARSDWISD
jgi:toxin ParE1/3/4